MNLRSKFFAGLAAVADILAGAASQASADVVTVGQLGTVNLTAGSQSGYITIPVFDVSGPAVQTFGFSLALRIVPLGGATGTVTIDQASLAYPSNYIFPSGDRFPATAPGTQPNTPTASDLVVFGGSNSFGSYPINSSGQNLLDLKFNTSGLASGNFDLRLVEVNKNSYWTDGSSVDRAFFVNGTPLTLQTPGSLSIGTLSVSAVPEPSSMLLAGSVVEFAAWRVRRKRRKAAEAAPTIEAAPA